MINIKVIEIKKCYQWLTCLLTCAMCLLAFRVLVMDNGIFFVQAKGMSETDNLIQIEAKEAERSKVFELILNKTFPMMEVHFKLEYGQDSFPPLYKLALGKIIKFDYQDPKTLLKAQLSVLSEVNDDLAEVGYNFPSEEKNDNDVINEREINFVEMNLETNSNSPVTTSVSNNSQEISASQSQETGPTEILEDISTNIPIITSPLPIKMPNKVMLDSKQPTILIYHTHGTESYLPEDVGNFHSLNERYTVRAVGKQLTEQLTEKGLKIIYDDTLHDYPSYQQSYVRGLETLKNNLRQHASLKIILDIHRDAAPENEEARKNSFVVINNEKVARFCIVVGTQNDNAEQLMTFAEYVKAKSDEMYPGLAKKTITKDFKFNQYNSDYYALIEVGNTANDINEALRTSKYLAEILNKVINDIKE